MGAGELLRLATLVFAALAYLSAIRLNLLKRLDDINIAKRSAGSTLKSIRRKYRVQIATDRIAIVELALIVLFWMIVSELWSRTDYPRWPTTTPPLHIPWICSIAFGLVTQLWLVQLVRFHICKPLRSSKYSAARRLIDVVLPCCDQTRSIKTLKDVHRDNVKRWARRNEVISKNTEKENVRRLEECASQLANWVEELLKDSTNAEDAKCRLTILDSLQSKIEEGRVNLQNSVSTKQEQENAEAPPTEPETEGNG